MCEVIGRLPASPCAGARPCAHVGFPQHSCISHDSPRTRHSASLPSLPPREHPRSTDRFTESIDQFEMAVPGMRTSAGQTPINIFTLKWGDRYGPDYVNRLYSSVRTNLTRPFRFFCLTDNDSELVPEIEVRPLPSIDLPESHARTTWMKLGLFVDRGTEISGDCLFMDLDILITGNIDCFFDYMPGKRCIIHNWIQRHQILKKLPDIGNSSIFRWPANTMQYAVDKFYSEQDWALTNFHPPQVYLTYALGEKYWWPESWVRSFKRHAVPIFPLNMFLTPKVPGDTRILVFHGLPDPHQAIPGYRPRKLHRWTRPSPWIRDYWGDIDNHRG